MLRGPLAFFGTAALFGIIFYIIFFSFNPLSTNISSVSHPRPPPWLDDPSAYSQETCAARSPPPIKYLTVTADAPAPTATVFKDRWANVDDMTLEQIREMVSKTKGLFARDFSLGLGWNNVSGLDSANIPISPIIRVQMRYIFEAALLHATMLNRTLVIPSFVYSRSCEFDM